MQKKMHYAAERRILDYHRARKYNRERATTVKNATKRARMRVNSRIAYFSHFFCAAQKKCENWYFRSIS